MSGWSAFRMPKEEVSPDTFSKAVDEDDFDRFVAVRTLVECDYDSSFDCSDDVSADSSVPSHEEEFYEDNGNVFGCLPSSFKSERNKQSYETYEVQPKSSRSVTAAVATYPGILNIQILEQRKPSLYPNARVIAAKQTCSLQKSSRKASSCKRIKSNAIKPPHTPTSAVTPVLIAERPEVMAAFESWKASSRKRVLLRGPDDMETSQAFKPLHTPTKRVKPVVIAKRPEVMAEGRKQPFVTYEVQPEAVHSVAVTTYPEILDVQIFEQRKPSLNPYAGVIAGNTTTSIQKLSRASMTRPDDTETYQLGAVKTPHTPTTEMTPVVVAETPEVMAAMKSVAKWKASSRKRISVTCLGDKVMNRADSVETESVVVNERSEPMSLSTYLTKDVKAAMETVIEEKASSTSNFKKGSEEESQKWTSPEVPKETSLASNFKEDREEAPQLYDEKLMLMLNGREQPEETDLNTMVEARQESLISIDKRLSSTRRMHVLTSDSEEKIEEKESNTVEEMMHALSAFSVRELEDEHQHKEKKASLTSKDDKEKPEEMTTKTMEDVMTSTSIVKELREEVLRLEERKNLVDVE